MDDKKAIALGSLILNGQIAARYFQEQGDEETANAVVDTMVAAFTALGYTPQEIRQGMEWSKRLQ